MSENETVDLALNPVFTRLCAIVDSVDNSS